MKFLYEYRTRDNVRHEGEIVAADREAAFSALRAKGIRPGRLIEAPGFFNKLFGKGKRWMVIAVLAFICAALSVAFFGSAGRPPKSLAVLDSTTRRQVIGDAAIIEQGIRTGWADIFPEEGERFLASFAIPGVPAGQRNTTESEIRAAMGRKVLAADSDGIEARQIKAMVEGMKDELRQFVADGGTIIQFGRRLVQRQEEELVYYNRVKNELETAAKSGRSEEALEKVWEERNAKLRAMGIKLVPMPEQKEESGG